eukprot:2026686-Prymnesium_polylepis.1
MLCSGSHGRLVQISAPTSALWLALQESVCGHDVDRHIHPPSNHQLYFQAQNRAARGFAFRGASCDAAGERLAFRSR